MVSLSYDRPLAITLLEDLPLSSTPDSTQERLYNFSDSCHHLFVIANKISQAQDRAKASGKPLSLSTIWKYRESINRIETQSSPHMRNISLCLNRDDYIQHYLFLFFSDSVMLSLCRPALFTSDDGHDSELARLHLDRCRSVLRSYLELLRLSCPIRRSWVFVHVTLSSALTLGLASSIRNDLDDQDFLERFVDALSKTTICANVPAYESALSLLRSCLRSPDSSAEGIIYY